MISLAVLLNELASLITGRGRVPLESEVVFRRGQLAREEPFSRDHQSEVEKVWKRRSQDMAGQGLSFWLQTQMGKFLTDFDKTDADKNGSLKFAEVKAVLEDNGFHGNEDDVLAIFRHLDANKDSKISRDEFSKALTKVPKVNLKQIIMRRAFKNIDKDGNGFLTREEIVDAANNEAGIDVKAEKIADLLIALAKDKDQKFSYEEFLQVFLAKSTSSHLRELFKKLDKDDSGFLSHEEILTAVKADDELSLQAQELSDLLISKCRDKMSKVNYIDFIVAFEKTKIKA